MEEGAGRNKMAIRPAAERRTPEPRWYTMSGMRLLPLVWSLRDHEVSVCLSLRMRT